MKKKYIIGIALGIAVLFGAVAALANPSFFAKTYKMVAATSTITYMTPGTATTTLTFDAYLIDQSGTSQNPTALDGLSLAIQFHASSAPITNLRWRYQYSQDNQDWYDLATSTNLTAITNENSWIQNSTSTAYSASGLSTSSLAMMIDEGIPVAARYIRVQFFLPTSALSNGGVWAEFIPIKEEK